MLGRADCGAYVICVQVSAIIRAAVLSCEPVLLARLSVLYDAAFEAMVSISHSDL